MLESTVHISMKTFFMLQFAAKDMQNIYSTLI
jgi:hypothetical protein